LHAGESFDEVIEAQLRSAKAVVVLWSKRSVASRWVRAEATIADRMNKLAPVLIEPCDRPIIFELLHTTDLTEWSGDREDPVWQRFLADLRHTAARTGSNRAAREEGAAAPAFLRSQEPLPAPAQQPARSAAVLDAPKPRTINVAVETSERTQFSVTPTVDPLAADFHCLELASGGQVLQRYVVSPSGLKIGRTPPADVILPDPGVSRAHCIVELADDRLRVTDLRSTNGTFIDGERVEGVAFLEVGSELRIGNLSLKHQLRGATEA
jgi:hypothetical protein